MKLMILILVTLLGPEAYCTQWAFRARENYEVFKVADLDQTFTGLSSTINFVYEEPYKYGFGIGLNPALGSFEEKDGISSSLLGNEINVYQLGGDAKYFPVDDIKGFIRGTLFYQLIDTKTQIDNIGGYGASVSVGWEFWLFDTFSLAPEVGQKFSRIRTDQDISTFFVSIGVHFYKFKLK